jgi:Flp pilus assembly protein TadG
MTRHKQSCGQAYVITILFLTVLLAMSAAVLDVGAWYRADRDLQATVDAAALAGAQELPYDSVAARALALSYAAKNGGGVVSGGVTFTSKIVANDTITVNGSRPAKGLFAKVLGIKTVTVHATASARAANVQQVYGVAPITVNYKHPLLNCTRGANPTCSPTFGVATTLDLEDIHQPGSGDGSGAFGLINLDQNDSSGTASSGTLADWVTNGSDQLMNLGKYYSVTSAKFNSSEFIAAMQAKIGQELLFPVYRLLTGPGVNATYDIIGWVGFRLTGFDPNGTPALVNGSFTKYIADGVQVSSGGKPAFGVRDIALTQ